MKNGTLLKGIFSMIRFPNLVIICLSLYLTRYTIVKPILGYTGISSSISDQAYLLMVAATLLIAAAGYVINDYFDTGIDAINKPGKNKTGTFLPRKAALILYVFLNISAFVIIWYFGHLQGIRYPILIYLLSAGLLYFYSSSYKKMLLTGNLVIAFLSALTIGLSILFDQQALLSEPVKLLITAYALFAFLMTLIREIIKDCEDAAGDGVFGANTLPVLFGIKTAHIVAALLTAIMLVTIAYIQVVQNQWQNKISFIYTTACIQTPLLILMIRNVVAKTTAHDKRNSILAKMIMVTGLFSMLIFHLSSN